MKSRFGRLIALLVVSAGAALAVTAPAASAATCANVTGSGSSLQAIAQEKIWTVEFNKQTKYLVAPCSPSPTVTYVATSSGKGLNCWGASKGELDKETLENCGTKGVLDGFVGSDVGPEGGQTAGNQIELMNKAGGGNQVVTTPVAQSAIAMLVSMPVGCEPTNQGVKPRIEDVGLEEQWFSGGKKLEELVKTSNGGWKGCPMSPPELQLYVRSVGSGTTAGFKRFLVQINKGHWEAFTSSPKTAENTEWPKPDPQIKVSSEKGKELAKKVYERPGSMGYADLSDARAVGFEQLQRHETSQAKFYSFYVEVENKNEGTYASPEESGGAANCKNVEYETKQLKVGPDQDWSNAKQINALKGENGEKYPDCTLTFDVAWHSYSLIKPEYAGGDVATANTVLDYLRYIVTEGQQQPTLKTEHFAPMPTEVQKKAEEGVNSSNIG